MILLIDSRSRLRAIKMPRSIMFPESDTEPEKYSRRYEFKTFL